IVSLPGPRRGRVGHRRDSRLISSSKRYGLVTDRGGRQPPISNRGHAAIDREVYARDEACFVGRKEQGGRRDLLRAAEPSKRNRRGELGSGLVGPFLGRRLLVEDRRV